MTIKGIDKKTGMTLGRCMVDILIEVLALRHPSTNLLKPVVQTGKALNAQRRRIGEVTYPEIERVCREKVPEYAADYYGIISVAAYICLQDVDFLRRPYLPEEYAQRLTADYLLQHPKQFSETEIARIRAYLPCILEETLSELNVRLEQDPSFQSKWRTLINNQMVSIVTHQELQDAQLAEHEERLAKSEHLPSRVAEYSDIYKDKWDAPLFLDQEKRLKEVYQLPSYQYADYGSDSEAEDCGNAIRYHNIRFQLEETIVQANNTEKRMLVILGLPGGGKSTLITYLLNDFQQIPGRKVLVYRFSNFEGIDWNGNPENIPQRMLNEMGLTKEALGNSVLILDGLDEVAMHSNHEELLNSLYQQWSRARSIPYFSLIVTCRRNRISSLEDLRMRHILLCPFDSNQILNFACKYWGKTVDEFDCNEVSIIERINDGAAALSAVMGIPLILYMMLALRINFSKGAGLCDIYNKIFSVDNKENSIYYRRYDTPHPITSQEASKIHDFSKGVAELIWEFNPTEGVVEKEKYEPLSNQLASFGEDNRLRDLLVGQYFMEGKNGCQLLFVHRSMHEYFIALSFYDKIKHLIDSGQSPQELYRAISFEGEKCELTEFANLLGMQNLSVYPDIQDYMLQMLSETPVGDSTWWKSFFNCFLGDGLADAAAGRPKAGKVGLNEELTRFHNLLWLTREQLRIMGHPAPFTLCDNLVDSIYFQIPRDEKRDLQDLVLEGISLPGYSFRGVQLCRSHMEEAVLSYADFSDTNLSAASLCSAELERCTFSYANLTNANLSSAYLAGAQFDNAVLENAIFCKANLTGACFDHADLSNADFSGAILDNASFVGAVINRTFFNQASMRRAKLDGLKIVESSFDAAILAESSLVKVRILHNTSMKNTDMQRCNLSFSDFSGVDFSFAKFRGAQIIDSYLCNCSLTHANLCDADLSDADFENADLSEADLRCSIAENAVFTNADMTSADLRGTYLTHAGLFKAKLYKVKANQDTFNAALFDPSDWEKWDIEYSDSLDMGDSIALERSRLEDLMEIDYGVWADVSELETFRELCEKCEELDRDY